MEETKIIFFTDMVMLRERYKKELREFLVHQSDNRDKCLEEIVEYIESHEKNVGIFCLSEMSFTKYYEIEKAIRDYKNDEWYKYFRPYGCQVRINNDYKYFGDAGNLQVSHCLLISFIPL